MTNGVLWMEVVITVVFVALRLYTRHQILNAVGIDDYLCSLALVSKDHHMATPCRLDANMYVTSPGPPHRLHGPG